jgi:hypothetical protein
MNWIKLSQEIFKLQNKIRTDPKSFVTHLEKSLKRFKGKVITTEDGCAGIET